MPTTAVAKRYYPKLSEVITLDDLPEFLSFAREGLAGIFDKIHYKNLQYSKSYRGDAAFYSLDIVSREIGLNLPFGLRLILNPDEQGDPNISSFPITLEYQWEILAYLRAFKLSGFSFTPEAFYELGLQIFRVSEDQVLAHTLNYFVEPANDTTNKFEQLVNDINTFYPSAGLVLPSGEEPTVAGVVSLINQNPNIPQSVSPLMFGLYLFDDDLEIVNTRLQEFYNLIVPEGIEAFIRKLIIPKARVSLQLSAAIEFPTTVLQPVDVNGNIVPGTTKFKFAEAILYADTEAGIGYKAQIGGSLIPQYSQIGNTGLIIEFTNALLDLSKTTNIPQADAAGYSNDFTGVFIQSATIGLPKTWLQNEDAPPSSVRITGKNLLIGTGGFSGTIALKRDNDTDLLHKKIGGFEIGLNAFDITFLQNSIISSNIRGSLKVKGFKDALGNDAEIAVLVNFDGNGDFNITAIEADGIPLVIEGVFTFFVKSLTLGKQDSRYFIGTTGDLLFDPQSAVGKIFDGPLEIGLKIWDDGSIQLLGLDGAFKLKTPKKLVLGPAAITITAIHHGTHEQVHNGLLRKYWFFGFDGGININPGGIDARGDGVKLYFTVDNGPLHVFFRIQSISIDLIIPAKSSAAEAAVIIKGYLSMKQP
ncbi:hypothetical protein, partial [Pedobacter glucosidilyticus]|uniref:hypothetical protein n=1 Tax=Pedobacter glucosidilyticus TaxID=1122941 RepID=UPI000567F583